MITFKDSAKANGFFASGSEQDGYRIAVGNVTGYKRVVIFCEVQGYKVSDKPTAYPSLLKITKEIE